MILLFLSLVLLFCSILIFFHLSVVLLWKISIITTEFGHWFFILPLVIVLYCRFQNPFYGTSTVISVITIAILFFPSFSAMSIARSLPQRLQESFSGSAKENSSDYAFEWKKLWFSSPVQKIQKERIIYAHHGDKGLYFNFFRARSEEPAPCIIDIHTGGWDNGSPDEFETMNHYLASRGYAVAAISYRFAPKWKWPAQKEDAIAALSYIKQHSLELGIDSSRFILFGRSAGGQIAEAVAYTANDPSIKGCIAFYAPADLNFAYEHLSPEPDILDSRTLLENYLGGSQKEARANYDDASPYNHISSSTPPTLLIHGAKDPLTWYRQSERLAKKLADHSIPNLYLELPWGTHAFDYNFNGPGGQISSFAIENFLKLSTKHKSL
jgi:acetyl esterase/lipase